MAMTRTILALSAALSLALPAQAKKTRSAESLTCKDGTVSSSTGRGACSHHGGLGAPNETAKSKKDGSKVTPKGNGAITDKQETSEDVRQERQNHGTEAAQSGGFWSRMAGRSAKPPERTRKSKSGKTSPTAQCKDGSMSYAENHSGACSGHGGVQKWVDGSR